MNIRKLIIRELELKNETSVSKIQKKTGFNRSYINKIFQELRDEGKVMLVGKARNSYYVPVEPEGTEEIKKNLLKFSTVIKNNLYDEHEVLNRIKKETGIFINLKNNVQSITDYTFTEMLNNAIEHSRSEKIEIRIEKTKEEIRFDITDHGIGIFNNIQKKFNLSDEMEAIGELLKGRLTTAKEGHTGEGIFFTSKAADNMIIQSSYKKLIFNNTIEDIFVKDIKPKKGTKITCFIRLNSRRDLTAIFNQYTDEDYEFSKTKITVKLYRTGTYHVSRSQARRILTGLEKFKTIIFDFKDIETVGQGFADEIFRVWKNNHKDIELQSINQNENIDFMIKRAAKIT